MAPDARVVVEVGLAQARAVLVAPEAQRHRRHRLGQHQLADLLDHRAALLVERVQVGAERPRLQLAEVHRQHRAAADERRADVGPAGGREQPRVAPDVLVDPLEALRGQRRAGRADGAQRGQVAARGRLDPRLHARRDVARARAEARHPRLLGEVPEPVEVGRARVAVVEHDRGVGEQHGDEEVPHHPAGRREPEHAVALVRVQVQVHHLEVLEQDPALALHDRLRQAGGAGRVEHPERVVERHRLELELRRAEEALLPAAAVEVAEPHDRRADLRRDRLDGLARGRSRGRRSGSRRSPAAPSARSGRSGRTTLRAPNSGAAEDQTAPSDAVARNAAIVSGTFGR